MTREFVETDLFRKTWRAMGLKDDELAVLQDMILMNPHIGDVIPDTGGARKLRIQLEGRGKRGGARVIYVDIFESEVIYLLLAYPKNVQDNMTQAQKKTIQSMIEQIKGRNKHG